MTTIMSQAPVFVAQAGRFLDADPHRPDRNVATFVNCRARPEVVAVISGAFSVDVTVQCLTNAFEGEWVEPFGDVTLWLTEGHDGVEWIVIDFDGKGRPDAQIYVRADFVRNLLADVASVRLQDEVAVVEREAEQIPRPHGGGAL